MMHKHSQCMQYGFNKCAHLFAQMHTARNRGDPIAYWYSWFCLENCFKLEKSVSPMNLDCNFYCDCVKLCTDDDVTWNVLKLYIDEADCWVWATPTSITDYIWWVLRDSQIALRFTAGIRKKTKTKTCTKWQRQMNYKDNRKYRV